MSRELRPRKSRPSYTAMAGYGLEEGGQAEAGPSNQAPVTLDEDDQSGSEFVPEEAVAQADPSEASVELALDPELDHGDDQLDRDEAEFLQLDEHSVTFSNKVVPPRGDGKAKGKGKAKEKVGPEVVKPTAHGSGLSRTSKRQMYVLPTPSVHHRHRAVPLFSRIGRVERLVAPPTLFGISKVIPTNSFTQNPKVTDRLNKAWGYNVGSGPLWELVEDRGWYKEAVETVNAEESEANRRPRVYNGLRVRNGWQILNIECVYLSDFVRVIDTLRSFICYRCLNFRDAAPYLPTDTITTDEGNLKPPPPIACSFGPYGSQTRIETQMLQTHKMCTLCWIKFPNAKPRAGDFILQLNLFLRASRISSTQVPPFGVWTGVQSTPTTDEVNLSLPSVIRNRVDVPKSRPLIQTISSSRPLSFALARPRDRCAGPPSFIFVYPNLVPWT
jgi:transcription factor C subunit 6